MATNVAALEQASKNDSGSRWYLRDLPMYGAGLFAIAFMYVSIRVYQGAFALETGLDSTMPIFDVYWRRLLYIEIVVQVAFGNRPRLVPVGYAGSPPRSTLDPGRNQAVFCAYDVGRSVWPRSLLGGKLFRRAR